MTTNPNIRLAKVFRDRFEYWREYALATVSDRRIVLAVQMQERYSRAYRYLMRRANR